MIPADSKVHISRKGTPLGVYEFGQLGDMLERGQLHKTDEYFDEATSAWVPLAAWKEPDALGQFRSVTSQPLKESTTSGASRRHGGRSSRSHKGVEKALLGWIVSLFTLIIAVAVFAYATSLRAPLKERDEEVRKLKIVIEALKRENQVLAEIAPAGRLRAVITYEPKPGQVAIMSGATVGLYKRADVEAVLTKVLAGAPGGNPKTFAEAVEQLKREVSTPLAVTLTDSNGRIDMPVPEPGAYVLVASAGKATATGPERYLWLMGFQAGDQPSSVVLMNERNAISQAKPDLLITDVPIMVTGSSAR